LIVAQAGEMPTRKSTYSDTWFRRPESKFMVEWSEYVSRNGRTGRYPAGWFDFGQILAEATQSIVLRGVAPDKALADVLERYNRTVK
jgi:ABC-type glycerol-3-phosphate transport system substrate-binding protein